MMRSGGPGPNSAVDQIPDDESYMRIPSDLVTVERRSEMSNFSNIAFAIAHIAKIAADIQEEKELGT